MNPDPKESPEAPQELALDDKLTPVVLDIPTDIMWEAPVAKEANAEGQSEHEPADAHVEEVMSELESAPIPESSVEQTGESTVEPSSEPTEAPVYAEHPFTPTPFPAAEDLLLLMPFNKRSKKRLLKPIAITLLVALIVAAAVYLLFFAVMKPDYQNASDDVSTVRDKYSIATDLSLTSTASKIQTAKTAYAEFKTENEKLAGLRALQRDSDLKAKYDAYEVKAKAEIAYEDAFFPSFLLFTNANGQIDTLGTDANSFTADNVATITNIYKSINDIPNPELKSYVSTAIAIYQAMLPQVLTYESKTSTPAQKQTALTAIKASSDQLSTAGTKLANDLDATMKRLGLADSLTDLMDTLSAKLK